ncbi:MAG TPA: hypothetical protein VFD47_04555 [Actinomycetota bacterium]|nr:hypothetical protein [Actinomycetota bacterium]
MARNTATIERLRGGVDRLVNGAVDATVHLPLGIYDRTRHELGGIDAQRVRKTFEGLLEDFIDRGQDRIQPLERRLKREGRKVEGEVSEAVDEAKRTTRSVKKTAKKTTQRAKKTTQKTARKTTERSSKPKLPRASAPRTAGELPIASYASLTADEIVSRLTGLTQTDLAKVYKYEKAHENRATILNAIDDKLVDLPIPTYDALTADEIVERLGKLDESELKSIRRYEAATKMRATVLERIDPLLS